VGKLILSPDVALLHPAAKRYWARKSRTGTQKKTVMLMKASQTVTEAVIANVIAKSGGAADGTRTRTATSASDEQEP